MLNTVSEAPKPQTSLKAGIQMAQKDILKEQRKQIERLKRSFINYVVSSEFFPRFYLFLPAPSPENTFMKHKPLHSSVRPSRRTSTLVLGSSYR